jgi:putative ABC transport system permease protein
VNELFGIPMSGIAAGALAITVCIFLFVGYIAIRNPVMFKTGLRNIPRRPAQTALIVVGLMLSTLIITAAFGTGDTLTNSVTADVYRLLDEADEVIAWDTEREAASRNEQVVPRSLVEELRAEFAGDEDIQAFIPAIREPVPVLNTRSRLNEPTSYLMGYHLDDLEPFGGLVDVDGNPVRLSGNQVAINQDLQDEIEGRVGDILLAFFEEQQISLEVVAVVPTNIFGGFGAEGDNVNGGTVDIAFLQDLTGKTDAYDLVLVSNTGDVRSGVDRTDAVVEKLESFLEGTPYEVVPLKQNLLNLAELLGNAFTTIFVVFGLFSIAAGVLLIFLIFVMLAAERKPEMGMARAVGAKRRQIVESFLAEGMGYDLGSAVLGLMAGIAVTFLMVAIVNFYAGDLFVFSIETSFTLRGLVVSFCLGIIATFIVIFIASWRASRLNIVSAIRDIPESPRINPEQATWYGFLRALLNAFAALGYLLVSFIATMRYPEVAPITMLGLLLGLVGPFLYVLRGTNFAAPRDERVQGERISLWPFFTILGIPFYAAALLLVRFTRDRKPRSMPAWMLILGIFVMPVGLVLAALQDRRAPISWAIGLTTMGAILGILLMEWGIDIGQYFQFTIGFSLVVIWFAVLMRYFHIQERLAFTSTGILLLIFWYLPSEWLEVVLPEMQGDIEMFFVSGAAIITAATFVIVYNADIVLPLIGGLGARFGRIVPAIKTGIAYPLTARFRTGMTMAMIGLIMFSLVVMSAMNTNFAALFINEDTKGGYDIQVTTTPNNRIQDMRAAIERAGIDQSLVTAVGEVRMAFSFEAEVENIHQKGPIDADTGRPREFLRANMLGVDQGFIETNGVKLKRRAAGFESDEAVWEAIGENPRLAILHSDHVVQPDPFFDERGEDAFWMDQLEEGFQPFELRIRNASGATETLTVIGVMADAPGIFFWGMAFGKDVLLDVFPDAVGQRYYLSLADGVDDQQFARDLEAGLLTASVDSLQKLIDDQQAAQTGFLLVFQGFMGLGLIVGIAALGVVASRSVIERRQQIGMLRAIGYQRSMVALTFVFESAFIAISGIIMGLVLGLALAWLLFTVEDIGEGIDVDGFIVPWTQLGIISAIALTASLLMTFLPARSASRVPIAEALRYE